MPDFNALLDKNPLEFERPPTPPEGEYLVVVRDKKFGQSSQKKTPFVEFSYGVISALPSIPDEALNGVDLSKVKFRDEFYLTEDAMFRLREFLELLGCTEGSTRDAIESAIGQQVVVTVGHETSQRDPSRIFANMRGYVKPE